MTVEQNYYRMKTSQTRYSLSESLCVCDIYQDYKPTPIITLSSHPPPTSLTLHENHNMCPPPDNLDDGPTNGVNGVNGHANGGDHGGANGTTDPCK